MTPPDKQNQQPLDLTSTTATTAATEKGAADKAKEAPDLRQKTLDELRASAKGEVSRQSAELQATGKNIDEPTQRYLEQYFQSAINRFDKDKDGKINESEARDFQTAMIKKTQDIIGQVKQGADAEKKMEAAASKAEAMKPEEIGKNLESIKAVGDLSDLEQANTELQNLQTQNTAFQQGIQTQLAAVSKFGADYNNFQQAQEGFGHFKEIYNAVVNSTEREVAIAKMKGTLEATKTAVNAALTDLTAKKTILDDNGEKIKAAIAKARQEAIKARDEKVAEIEKSNVEQKEKVAEKKQEYERLGKVRENMEKRQKGILDQQNKTEQLKKNWAATKEKEQLDTREKAYKDSQLDIEAEIEGYKVLLDSPDIPPEAKEKIKQQYEQAQKRQQQTGLGLQVVDAKRKSGAAYEEGLDEQQKAAGKELNTTEGHLKRQQETMTGLSQNISNLEGLQLQYATSADQAKEYFNKRIDLLDKHQESVDEHILNGAMGRQQSLNTLQQSANSINSLTVETKGFWQLANPLEIVGSAWKGVGGLLHSGGQWIDGNIRSVLDMTRNSDSAFEKSIYYGTQFLSVFTGFVSGALELGGGLFTLSGGLVSDIGSMPSALLTWDSKKLHFDTFKSLGAVIGYDGAKGEFTLDKFGETWATMFKSLVGYGTNWGYSKDANGKEVWKDEYGTGLGKGVFNVLSMFVGAGEVKAAALGGEAAVKAGSTLGKASIAADAARLAVLDAAEAAGRGAIYKGIAGRGAQVLEFARTLATELKPGFISKAATEGRLAPGIIGKTKAIAGSLVESAAGGRVVKAIRQPNKLGRAGEALLNGTKTTLKYAAKGTAEIIAMPVKLTWNTLKAFRNTGSAFRNVARGLSNPRAVAAAEAASRIGNAAGRIEAHGATAAKAEVRLQEIISSDSALSRRAAELDANAGKLSAEQLAAQRLELQEAAVQKMKRSDPALADAYKENRQVSNYDQSRARLQEIIDGDPALAQRDMDLKANADNLPAEQITRQRMALESEAARKMAKSDPALAQSYQEVRRASADLQKEANKYIKSTKKEVDSVLQDPGIKATRAEYTGLQEALEEAKKANNTARITELEGDLKAFRENPAKMDQAMRFEEAQAAEASLPGFGKQLQELQDGLLQSRSGSAVNLANEIAEARAVRAPAGSREADFAITNSQGFAKDFIERHQKALAAGDEAAVVESLGTVHSGGPLEEALEGLRLRQRPGFVAEPAVSNAFKFKSRGKLQNSLEHALETGDFTIFNKLKNKVRGNDLQYVEWMEDLYKNRPLTEARSILRSDQSSFAEALRANQDKTLSIYKEFERRTQAGTMTSDDIAKFVTDHQLPVSWKSGLEQMQKRFSFKNKMDSITGELALNRLRVEYRRVITPEMTGLEAAEELSRRYANDTLRPAAEGVTGAREVATNIRLKNGNYTMRVLDDGSVRLFNQSGEMLMTYSESRAARAGLDIRPTVKAQELADQIGQRAERPGTHIGANEPRLVAENIELAEGKYSIKLNRNGSMKLVDADGKVVAPTKVAPSAVPQAAPVAAAPAAPRVAPAAAPRARRTPAAALEARERQLQQAIEADPALKVLNAGDDLGKQIARGKAEVKMYQDSLPASTVRNKLQALENDLNAARAGSDAAKTTAAEQALESFKKRPDYQEYFRYQEMGEGFERAAQNLQNKRALAIIDTNISHTAMVKNGTMRRLNTSMTAEEAADILARENFAPGMRHSTQDLGTVTLRGNKEYVVRLTENGEFRLFDNSSQGIIASERAAQPVVFESADLTADSLLRQPENSTVAFGTGSATGDWVEVTKLPGGKHQVVMVRNGKTAEVIEGVENLRIMDDAANAGRRQLTWERQGKAGEYANIQEVFRPAKYETVRPVKTPVQKPVPVSTPAAAPATGPIAAPKAAPAVQAAPRVAPPKAPRVRPAPKAPVTKPELSPADRARNAIETRERNLATYRSSQEKIISLEERLAPMEERLNAMRARKVPEAQIRSMEEKIKALTEEKNKLTQAADRAADDLWNNRKDYWKARIQERGQAVRKYISMESRINWLKQKSNALGKLAETGWKGVQVPIEYLRKALSKQTEYFSVNMPQYLLLSRVGLEINQRMSALRIAAGSHPEVNGLLGELAIDQYRILHQIGGDNAKEKLNLPPANEFAAMTPEQQTAAIGAAYNQLEGRENTGTFYNEAQKDYIKDKEVAVATALEALRNDPELTPDKVAAAIATALGPEGLNDAQKGYEINFEGVKITVGKDGKRTVEGADRWVTELPLKRDVTASISENATYYSQVTRDQFKKDNPGQTVDSYEAFKKQVTDRVATDISKRLEGRNVGAGVAVESAEKTKDGNAAFVATVSPAGVEVTPDENWLRGAYDNFQKSPDKTPVARGPGRSAPAQTTPENQESVETPPDEENIYS